ncbi:hypothetical protein [Pseudomonas monsensis]
MYTPIENLENKIREMMKTVTDDKKKTAEDRKTEEKIDYKDHEFTLKVEANGSTENISIQHFVFEIDDAIENELLLPGTYSEQIQDTIQSKTIYCAVSVVVIDSDKEEF